MCKNMSASNRQSNHGHGPVAFFSILDISVALDIIQLDPLRSSNFPPSMHTQRRNSNHTHVQQPDQSLEPSFCITQSRPRILLIEPSLIRVRKQDVEPARVGPKTEEYAASGEGEHGVELRWRAVECDDLDARVYELGDDHYAAPAKKRDATKYLLTSTRIGGGVVERKGDWLLEWKIVGRDSRVILSGVGCCPFVGQADLGDAEYEEGDEECNLYEQEDKECPEGTCVWRRPAGILWVDECGQHVVDGDVTVLNELDS